MRAGVLAAILCVLSAYGLDRSLPADGELRDFGSFVGSGLLAAEGRDPYGIHDLTPHVEFPGFEVWNPNLNPPLSIPLFRAVATTASPGRAFRLWWSISLLCYLVTLGLLVRRYGAGTSWLLPLWALALAGVWDTLALGQIYLPLVLAAVVGWLMLDDRREVAAGVLIGCVVAFKPNFAVWPALLFLAGHRRPALVAAVAAVALSATPLFTYGDTVYRQWAHLILTDGSRGAFVTNASISGLAQRLHVGGAGTALSVGLLAALALWAVRRRPSPMEASAVGLLGGIAASPIAWVHYTLFLLPVFFSRRLTAPLLAAAALLVVPVPIVLRFVGAPAWQQITIGSVYAWAVLLCLPALLPLAQTTMLAVAMRASRMLGRVGLPRGLTPTDSTS